MKKSLLLLSTLFYLNALFAQPFIPILNGEHQWSHDNIASLGGFSIVSSNLFLDGTVVYNGITYQLIHDTLNGSCLAVREENGILYYYYESENIEFPVLDFNLEIGDTFNLPNIFLEQCFFVNILASLQRTVTNVEYLTIAGAERKVITLEGPEEIWYEGIGSTLGIVPYLGFDYDILLVCFTLDGETTFFNGATACDNTTLSVPENLEKKIVLAPNPVNDISILQLPSELNIDNVRIYDITGKVISEENITKNYTRINAMDYAAGLYFYQILSDNRLLKSEKFIIK